MSGHFGDRPVRPILAELTPRSICQPRRLPTDPTWRDTDRDGVDDPADLDPLHDVMVRLTLDDYFALDGDPDFDEGCPLCGPGPAPEPFVEVVHRGESFYTPHLDPGPAGSLIDLDKVYTLDIPDFTLVVTFTFRAWDDDLALGNDKQWDLDGASCGLDAFVTFDLRDESTEDRVATGLESDGAESYCSTLGLEPEANALRNAELFYRVDTVRPGRIPTILVDSLDTDDLLETASGDFRYLGDDVFYLAWINATSPSEPSQKGLKRGPRAAGPVLQLLPEPHAADLDLGEPAGVPRGAQLHGLRHGGGGDGQRHRGGLERDPLRERGQPPPSGPCGEVNGAHQAVTDQLVTLGLPDRVVQGIPLEGIQFDQPTGAGPGTSFEDFVAAFLSAVNFLVQGLVLVGTAIATFFEQAVDFLVNLGMAVLGTIGAFLGQVGEAVEKVGDTLFNFVDWLVSLIVEAVAQLVQPVVDAFAQTAEELALLAVAMATGTSHGGVHTPEGFAGAFQRAIFLSPLFFAILGLIAGIAILQGISTGISFGLAPLILSLALGIVASLLLGIVLAEVIESFTGTTVIQDVIPEWYDDVTSIGFSIGAFALLASLFVRQNSPAKFKVTIVNVVWALAFSLLTLLIVSAKTLVPIFESDPKRITVANTILDFLAMAFAVGSVVAGIEVIGRGANLIKFHHWLLIPLTIIFSGAAVATSFSGFAQDCKDLADQTGQKCLFLLP